MNKLLTAASIAILAGLGASGCVVDPTYTYCNSASECEASEQCLEVTTAVSRGAFCTNACEFDSDCERNLGFGGVCLNPDAMGAICFQGCNFDSDCFSSSVCVDFTDTDGFSAPVCLPDRL